MEEKQVQEFVHRALNDDELRDALKKDAETVLMKEHFSPRVTRTIKRLVPHLLAGGSGPDTDDDWWDY